MEGIVSREMSEEDRPAERRLREAAVPKLSRRDLRGQRISNILQLADDPVDPEEMRQAAELVDEHCGYGPCPKCGHDWRER